MDTYDVPGATKPILPFIDDASNWYVRRSRRRFWKSGDDDDKRTAYKTLHYVLVQLAHVIAPFTPFMAEELYRKLTDGESVHLRDWPAAGHVNELIIERMSFVRNAINDGLSQRAAAGIKVRQPLQSVSVPGAEKALGEDYEDMASVITEELNVKTLNADPDDSGKTAIDTSVTPALKREGLAREIIRNVQNTRKQAGLQVDDRIRLGLVTDDRQLRHAIEEHGYMIAAETLASGVSGDSVDGFTSECMLDGKNLAVSLTKV